MTPLPATPANLDMVRRIIWFEPPEIAIKDPIHLLAYAFRYAVIEDLVVLRHHFSDADLTHALINAPPGIIDERSWAYWNLILRDLSPPPPMPTRTVADTKASPQ